VPPFKRTEANVADDPTPAITEPERKILNEHQFALATAAEVVENGVANYNACLAELQEVAAPIVARLRADYGAGSPASVSIAALMGVLEAIASMNALTSHSLG
jgi:hypothetical protein